MLDAIRAHAAGSRHEVCGLLLGPPPRHPGLVPRSADPPDPNPAAQDRHDVHDVRPCANVHSAPATHFELDPAALLAAHRAARAGGPAAIGHYHSHPSGRAEPSATDAAMAAPDGAIWIIVAGDTVAAWRASGDGAWLGRFDPVTIRVVPPCAGQVPSPQRGMPDGGE